MTTPLINLLLLVLWPLLLWPAVRLTGKARIWIVTVAGLGALAAGYEIWATFVWAPNVVAPIRFDINLISLALAAAYASAVPVLSIARWRKTAALLCLVVVTVVGVMVYVDGAARREAARLTVVFREQNALLFAAKFRDRATFDAYFGTADGGSAPNPAGHWQAAEQSNFSRLIVNPAGQSWLFYRCGDTECHFGPEELKSQPSDNGPTTWATLPDMQGDGRQSLRVTRESPDRLNVQIDGNLIRFVKAPPPIDPSPAPEMLDDLGPFSALECEGQHAKVRQVWLWRDGATLYSVGNFATKLAGVRADFLSPMVMGTAEGSDDGWVFKWSKDRKYWKAIIALAGDSATLMLFRDGRAVADQVLSPGAVIRDEAVELAPRTTAADWAHWFDTVLVGHFAAGDLPPC